VAERGSSVDGGGGGGGTRSIGRGSFDSFLPKLNACGNLTDLSPSSEFASEVRCVFRPAPKVDVSWKLAELRSCGKDVSSQFLCEKSRRCFSVFETAMERFASLFYGAESRRRGKGAPGR